MSTFTFPPPSDSKAAPNPFSLNIPGAGSNPPSQPGANPFALPTAASSTVTGAPSSTIQTAGAFTTTPFSQTTTNPFALPSAGSGTKSATVVPSSTTPVASANLFTLPSASPSTTTTAKPHSSTPATVPSSTMQAAPSLASAPAVLTSSSQSTASPFALPPTSAGASKATTTQPASLPASAPPDARLQSKISTKSVEQTINDWNKELDDASATVIKHARHVAEWDKLLIENGDKILDLHRQAARLTADQKEVDSLLDDVNSSQQSLHSQLDKIVEYLRRFQDQGADLNAADFQREKSYKLVDEIELQMTGLQANVKEMVRELNKRQQQQQQADTPMAHIVEMLNEHLSSLQWIDQTLDDLQASAEATTGFVSRETGRP